MNFPDEDLEAAAAEIDRLDDPSAFDSVEAWTEARREFQEACEEF